MNSPSQVTFTAIRHTRRIKEQSMESGTSNVSGDFLKQTVDTAKMVILKPKDFFQSMPKLGGFKDPLLFAVAMGLASGIVALILGILGLGMHRAVSFLFLGLILSPLFTAIGAFIAGAILYLIWKAMGSQQTFETAFRCVAYMTAVSPFTTLLGVVPYLGALIGLLWMLYLTVAASTIVHGIEERKAWTVFGAIAVIFALLSIYSQRQVVRMERQMGEIGKSMEEMGQMTPEELGESVGKFMKGVQQGSGQGQ